MAKFASLQQLLKEPFGPYPDELILQNHGIDTIQLTSVRLQFEGSNAAIGLDDTEWPTKPIPTVYFFGVVEIDKLSQLTDQGLDYLQTDFTQRDLEMSGKAPSRPVKLVNLYQPYPTFDGKLKGLHMSVWIRGKKTVSANFMNEKCPKSLIIQSSQRRYEVLSMGVETYAKSRNFFERFRLHSLIRKFATSAPETPVSDRTIHWLVSQTLEHHKINSQILRIIHHPKERAEHKVAADGQMVVIERPRALRRIARAEIANLYARHAEWLLAMELDRARSGKSSLPPLINLKEWHVFCLELRKHPPRWGLDIRLSDRVHLEEVYGGNRSEWDKRINGFFNSKKRRRKSMTPLPDDAEPPGVGGLVYDMDFSEDSTPSPSDSDYASEEEDPLSSSLLLHVPAYCQSPPRLEPGQRTWYCPDPRCNAQIDLMFAKNTRIQGVPTVLMQRYKKMLEERKTRLSDTAREVLYPMVSNHYDFEHLRPNGIFIRRLAMGKVVLSTKEMTAEQAVEGEKVVEAEDVAVEVPDTQQ